tara:strand:+ start:154 stop:1152 length:999 start_codon:yes stop_codon:yes gene_type:complete
MTYYTCDRCGFNTNIRTHFVRHLTRKNICLPILKDISLVAIVERYRLEKEISSQLPPTSSQNLQNGGQMTHIPSQNPLFPSQTHFFPSQISNSNQNSQNNALSPVNSVRFLCPNCLMTFSRKDNLIRHQKIRCKNSIKPENRINLETSSKEDLVNVIESMSNKIGTINSNNTNTSNNQSHNTITDNKIQQNISNNIVINNFGEEKTEHITSAFLDSLICAPFSSIPKLTNKIHFDSEHTDNKNIKITNRKDRFAKVFKNNEWVLVDRRDTIDDMIDTSYNILDEHGAKHIEKFNGFKRKNWTNFITRYDNEDAKMMKRIKNKIELDIINNSK